jgi:DNA-binding transcriptional ArsR family regulator
LADALPVTRPAVSLHLKVLRDAHLVQATPVGTRRVYRLDAEGIGLMRTYLDRLWAGALERFAEAAEAAHAADLAPTPDRPDDRRTPSEEDHP